MFILQLPVKTYDQYDMTQTYSYESHRKESQNKERVREVRAVRERQHPHTHHDSLVSCALLLLLLELFPLKAGVSLQAWDQISPKTSAILSSYPQ